MSDRAFPLIRSCCAGLFPAFCLFSRLSRPVGLSAIIIFFTDSHPRQPKKLLSLHKTVCISAIKRAYCIKPYSRYGKSWTQEIDANTEL